MCKALCSMPGRSRGKDGGRHGRKKDLALTTHANVEATLPNIDEWK